MKIPAGRLNEALQRLLPFLLIVAIAACGYLWLIQPRLGVYLRTQSEVVMLRDRVKTLQASASRARALPPADVQASLVEFERRVPREDKVAEVAAALGKAVLDSAPVDKLRGFIIETGDRVQQGADAGSRSAPHPGASIGGDGPDLRVALFPYAVSYTPIRITFESTFEAAGDFLWRIRDLPTVVEIRSAMMTRGLPLMKVDVLIRVFQRGEATDTGRVTLPGGAAFDAGGPTAPRVARPAGAEG